MIANEQYVPNFVFFAAFPFSMATENLRNYSDDSLYYFCRSRSVREQRREKNGTKKGESRKPRLLTFHFLCDASGRSKRLKSTRIDDEVLWRKKWCRLGLSPPVLSLSFFSASPISPPLRAAIRHQTFAQLDRYVSETKRQTVNSFRFD